MILPSSNMKNISSVRSHTQAISQCQKIITENKLEPIIAADTAGSAKYISDNKIKNEAAIASELAAEIYNLKIDILKDVKIFFIIFLYVEYLFCKFLLPSSEPLGIFKVVSWFESPAFFKRKTSPLLKLVKLDVDSSEELEIFPSSPIVSPNKIFGIKNKGFIKEGFDADLTIVDMDKEMIITNQQQKSKSKWTPFDGMRVKGWPTHTIVRGNCVMCNDEVLGEPIGEMVKFKETM